MSKSYSRAALYDLVWSAPISKLAPQYELSPTAISNACKAADIPRPTRGYWAKLAAGKSVNREPLPRRGFGMSDIVTVGSAYYYRRVSDEELLQTDLTPPVFEEGLESVRARVEALVKAAPIPKFPDHAHRQIRKLLEADEGRRLKYTTSRWPSSFDKPLFDDAIETRRLRLINAIMTALERAGMRPKIDGREGRSLCVAINDTTVHYTLDTISQKLEPRYRNAIQSRGVSNKLRCAIRVSSAESGVHKEWADTDKSRLDAHIKDIVIELIYFGEAQYRARQQRQYEGMVERKAAVIEKRRQEKLEAERKERERQAALEQARVDNLLGNAEAYRKASDIRSFVAEMTARFDAGDIHIERIAMNHWSEWALAQADRLDPVTNGTLAALALSEREKT